MSGQIHKYNYLNFSFFSLEKICFFYELQILFWKKTGCSLIDFDAIFPMQSSQFTKSLIFEIISKKTAKKTYKL